MNIEYTGRHTEVTAKLKGQAQAGLERIAKVATSCTNAHVILTEDKYRKIAEITLNCRGEQVVATAEAADLEQALHAALAKAEVQVVKHKERSTTQRDHGKVDQVEAA